MRHLTRRLGLVGAMPLVADARSSPSQAAPAVEGRPSPRRKQRA